MHTSALVMFSGGQDSTTCLALALSKYDRVETLGFDYGQRHHVELQARHTVRAQLQAQFPQWAHKLGEDHVLTLDVLQQIEGEGVRFLMADSSAPVIIQDETDASALFVLMPMRV